MDAWWFDESRARQQAVHGLLAMSTRPNFWAPARCVALTRQTTARFRPKSVTDASCSNQPAVVHGSLSPDDGSFLG
jgi:hypothetical protein